MHREHGRIRRNRRWRCNSLRPVCESGGRRYLLLRLGLGLREYGSDS